MQESAHLRLKRLVDHALPEYGIPEVGGDRLDLYGHVHQPSFNDTKTLVCHGQGNVKAEVLLQVKNLQAHRV